MYRTILVGTDGSDTAQEAVRAAAELARLHRADLHVVSAYDPHLSWRQREAMAEFPEDVRWRASPGQAAENTAGQAAASAAGTGREVQSWSEPGPARDVLVRVAERVDADLIVVGNRGMSGMGRLLGSVPSGVSQSAPCDVLIVDTVGRRAAAEESTAKSA